ncbi:hypothetical protein [Longispora albida]|uniref:hypothetical protein n=1 Tax=Longispora albida TaxID=203523 RepID=UPI00036B6FDF|nr:hypothetical protein [Longispora albida]
MTGELVRIERRELAAWLALACLGLGLTALAVHSGAQLGTASAPFLGFYRFQLGWTSLAAPVVALAVLAVAWRGLLATARWGHVLAASYAAALAWALALAIVDGADGLTRALTTPDDSAGAGHPPGPQLLLGWLREAGLQNLTIGVVLTALSVLTVPIVLIAVRGSCGDGAARAFAPVLILAPYAVWVAVSLDGIVALLGAAGVMLGERGSKHIRRGWRAFGLALAAGAVLGVAALFSYSVPWLGLSVICLYFARRRPMLHLATGLGALAPVLVATLAGFNWFDGLLTARDDFAARVEPHRSALWWAGISLVALLLAAGPALIASVRKLRNTPGWPFLVGAAVAIVFSVVAGFARGGVEHAWLPFFPWLLVAATAPEEQGGEPVGSPLLLVAGGAVTALVIEAVLSTPW